MHRHHVPEGEQVVQNREDALLHFAGVFASGDQHDFLREIDDDGGLGSCSILGRIGVKRGGEEQGELWIARRVRGPGRTNNWRAKSECQARCAITRTES